MSRPTLTELVIAVDTRTRFFLAAEAAPIGSLTENQAMREFEMADAEVKRVEKELAAYIVSLEQRVAVVHFDKRRL
jgi:hypothetical protein